MGSKEVILTQMLLIQSQERRLTSRVFTTGNNNARRAPFSMCICNLQAKEDKQVTREKKMFEVELRHV